MEANAERRGVGASEVETISQRSGHLSRGGQPVGSEGVFRGFRDILPSSVSAGVVMEVFCSESQKKLVVIHPTNAYRKGS